MPQQLNDSDGSAYQERYHEYILRKLREEKNGDVRSRVSKSDN